MANPIIPKVWITDCLLAHGIRAMENAELIHHQDIIMVRRGTEMHYYRKPDWHESEAEAKAVARMKIEKKRKSIAKQIAKLDALEKTL